MACLHTYSETYGWELRPGISLAIPAGHITIDAHGRRVGAVPDHARVYEAVRSKNPAAAERAMIALLDLALRDTASARRPRRKRR